METLRNALIAACNEMAVKAEEMNMKGVAVASILQKSTQIDWLGEMKVVSSPVNIEDGLLVAKHGIECAKSMLSKG